MNMQLLTVDKPTHNFSNADLVDMEVAEFVKIVSKMSCRELVLVMKVVSDGPKWPMKNLNSKIVSELIQKNLSLIFQHLEAMAPLAVIEKSRLDVPEEYKQILSKWHFSVTQGIELEKLIKRWKVSFPTGDLYKKIKKLKNAKEVIKLLKHSLNENEIDWSKV